MANLLRNCDVVMKGGVTSGVVFPLALVELSKEFRFRSIGGTSAGAIAAALTAAAEYRRFGGGGTTDGFDNLEKLPDYLGCKTDGQSNLLNLFPPTKSTRRLFAVATAFLGDDSMARKCLRATGAILVVSVLTTVICFLPVILFAILLGTGLLPGPVALTTGAVATLLAFVLGLMILIIVTVVRGLVVSLPLNNFGFSKGRKPEDRPVPGVTEWLSDELQKTAGRAKSATPLTFGDLWAAGQTFDGAEARLAFLQSCEQRSELRSINLQMMTTALSHGHPYRLPFENRIFSFNEAEFRDYFPAAVVDHLIASARAQASRGQEPKNDKLVQDSDAASDAQKRMYPMPPARDLPLVVCARLSLSFPVLFSMVPLYAIDYSSTGEPRKKCWFIDGGLSSNFPITFFDSPLPRWPTFGIDLTDEHPEHRIKDADPTSGVWMVNRNGDGTSEHWLNVGKDGLTLGGYVGAILDTIRNWHDNVQMAVPGYRDRIVHVKLRSNEGGLNLGMDKAKVLKLAGRGRQAGILLRSRFGEGGASAAMNWNNHRWIRYKSAVPSFRQRLRAIREGFDYSEPIPTYANYSAIVERTTNDSPKTGEWWKLDDNARAFHAATEVLLSAGKSLGELPTEPFDKEAPRPMPELRITPRL
jgi:hypothetical protein